MDKGFIANSFLNVMHKCRVGCIFTHIVHCEISAFEETSSLTPGTLQHIRYSTVFELGL